MHRSFEMQITTKPLTLSATARRALKNANRYDWILFTSQHAVSYFIEALRKGRVVYPSAPHIAAVGPKTADALRALGFTVRIVPEQYTSAHLIRALGTVRGMRILFPRSAVALYDAVRELRMHGARVQTIPLYTAQAARLSQAQKKRLVSGFYQKLLFKSPSGVTGFIRQFSVRERAHLCEITVQAIGQTTARAARKAGFKKVQIERRL